MNSTLGHKLLSFIDAFFFCYNLIKMDPTNEMHTFFIIVFGTYCYKVMLFGLMNARATFHQMVTEVFKP